MLKFINLLVFDILTSPSEGKRKHIYIYNILEIPMIFYPVTTINSGSHVVQQIVLQFGGIAIALTFVP